MMTHKGRYLNKFTSDYCITMTYVQISHNVWYFHKQDKDNVKNLHLLTTKPVFSIKWQLIMQDIQNQKNWYEMEQRSLRSTPQCVTELQPRAWHAAAASAAKWKTISDQLSTTNIDRPTCDCNQDRLAHSQKYLRMRSTAPTCVKTVTRPAAAS